MLNADPVSPDGVATIGIEVSWGIKNYMRMLQRTGLYGPTIGDVALRLIERGIEDRLNDGTIKRGDFVPDYCGDCEQPLDDCTCEETSDGR